MTPAAETAIRPALQRLNDAFCDALDRGTPEEFAALFMPDAYYSNGARVSHGRAEILAFARSRTAHAPRTSRHLQFGLRLGIRSPTRATGISCCVTYAASSLPPIATTAPVLVADFQDLYVLDGRDWRFLERRILPLLVGPTG